jgi:hypothetical protein
MKCLFGVAVICAVAAVGTTADAVPVDQLRSLVAMHERVRARFSPADSQVLDALCRRVRISLPRRARIPGDVRAVLMRLLPGLSPREIEVLTDYVSSDPSIGGAAGTGASTDMGGNTPIGSAAGGNGQQQLLAATKQMQETQMSFNLQYLQLQSQMQNENRQYTAISNIMKTKHDTVKNSIGSVR